MKKFLLLLISCQTHFEKKQDYVQEITLKNGLKVFYKKTQHAPLIAFSINFHIGSAYEQPGKTGATHFLEHLLFQKNSTNSYLETIESFGATYNAMTGKEKTVYYSVFSNKDFEIVLKEEAKRLKNFYLDQDLFEKERKIILEEKKQTESPPFSKFALFLQSYLFENTSMAHPVIGTEQDLNSITMDEISNYFHRYYDPKNAFIVLTGDLPDNFKDSLEKEFGTWQSKVSSFKKPNYSFNKISNKNVPYIENQLPKNIVYLYETLGETHQDFLHEKIFQIILSKKITSFFITSKNYTHLFLNMHFNLFSFLQKSYFIFMISPLQAIDPETVYKTINTEHIKLCESFQEEDFLHLSSFFDISFAYNLERNLSLNLKISETVFSGKKMNPQDYYDKINQISLSSLKNRCFKFFKNYSARINIEHKL